MKLRTTFLLFWVGVCGTGLHVDIDLAHDQARLADGEAKLMELRNHAKAPRYGQCWTNSLESLEAGCRQLTEDLQHRLALKFTHCFMLKSGRNSGRCDDDVDPSACTSRMQPEEFNAYTEFFTHTQNICFYLQAAVWHMQTEETIDRLADNSAVVAQQLEDTSKQQIELMHHQNVSIRNQEQLIEDSFELKRTIEESKLDVHAIMDELHRTTSEQRSLIFEVFDRVKSLQSLVMGEFTGFYSLIFYAVAVVIAYLLTSTPRTSGSRFWLFLILTLNITVEWSIARWYDGGIKMDPISGQAVDENTLVFERMRKCRVIFVTLAVLLWMWMAYRYKDLNQINNQLLVDIKRQNAELKLLLSTPGRAAQSGNGIGSKTTPASPAGDFAAKLTVITDNNKKRDELSAGYVSDTSDTEVRARPSKLVADSVTSTNSLQPVIVINTNNSLTTRSRRSDTADGFSLVTESPVSSQLPSTAETESVTGGSSRVRRRGRPRISESTQSSSFIDSQQWTTPGSYNLRSRHVTPSSASPTQFSNVDNSELIEKEVKHLAGVAARNRVKAFRTKAVNGRSQVAVFSSDED